jgi:hypothetical protein
VSLSRTPLTLSGFSAPKTSSSSVFQSTEILGF